MHALRLRPTSSAGKAVSHECAYDSYWKLHKTVYIVLNIQKRIDSLQEAFIHPPEPCDAHFNMDGGALFHSFFTSCLLLFVKQQ